MLFSRAVEAAVRQLFVDGSNVAQAWPELRVLWRRDRAAAREQLVRQLAALHDTGGWRVTVVFDGRGAELEVECPGGEASFAVLTAPSAATADTVIEQLVARARESGIACVVATADRAERATVEALGGQSISPEELAGWIERAGQQQGRRVAAVHREAERAWSSGREGRGQGGRS